LIQFEAGPPGHREIVEAVEAVGGEILLTNPRNPPASYGEYSGITGMNHYVVAVPYTSKDDFKTKMDHLLENAVTNSNPERMYWYQGPDPRRPPWEWIALGVGIVGTILGGWAIVKR